jgi:hypothetical protein
MPTYQMVALLLFADPNTTSLRLKVCMYMYVHMYVCTCVELKIISFLSEGMYLHTHACMCLFVYTYTHTTYIQTYIHQDIENATKIPAADLKRTMQSLACGMFKLLVKEPKGREVLMCVCVCVCV